MTADLDVFRNRHAVKQLNKLKGAHQTHGRDLVLRNMRDVTAIQLDTAGRRTYEARDHIEERGLAGPVWPDDSENAAPRHFQVDSVVGGQAAESLGEPGCLEESHCYASSFLRRNSLPSADKPLGA